MRMARVAQLGAIVPPGSRKTSARPGGIITHPTIAAIDVADVPLLAGGGVLSIVRPAVEGDNPVDGLRFAIAVGLDFLGIWIVPLLNSCLRR